MKPTVEIPYYNRPCAIAGLASYRYHRGGTRWIMIGATGDADALNEANRSIRSMGETANVANLQVWDGSRYIPCEITDRKAAA